MLFYVSFWTTPEVPVLVRCSQLLKFKSSLYIKAFVLILAFLVHWFLKRRFLNIFPMYFYVKLWALPGAPGLSGVTIFFQCRIFTIYKSFCVDIGISGEVVLEKIFFKICTIYFYTRYTLCKYKRYTLCKYKRKLSLDWVALKSLF